MSIKNKLGYVVLGLAVAYGINFGYQDYRGNAECDRFTALHRTTESRIGHYTEIIKDSENKEEVTILVSSLLEDLILQEKEIHERAKSHFRRLTNPFAD